jgi:hypothetical protein
VQILQALRAIRPYGVRDERVGPLRLSVSSLVRMGAPTEVIAAIERLTALRDLEVAEWGWGSVPSELLRLSQVIAGRCPAHSACYHPPPLDMPPHEIAKIRADPLSRSCCDVVRCAVCPNGVARGRTSYVRKRSTCYKTGLSFCDDCSARLLWKCWGVYCSLRAELARFRGANACKVRFAVRMDCRPRTALSSTCQSTNILHDLCCSAALLCAMSAQAQARRREPVRSARPLPTAVSGVTAASATTELSTPTAPCALSGCASPAASAWLPRWPDPQHSRPFWPPHRPRPETCRRTSQRSRSTLSASAKGVKWRPTPNACRCSHARRAVWCAVRSV